MANIQTEKPKIHLHRFNKTSSCVQSLISINGRDICNAYEAIERHLPVGTYLIYAFKGSSLTNSHIRILSKEYGNAKIVLALPTFLMAYHICPCGELNNHGGLFTMGAWKKLFSAFELGTMYELVITSDIK